MRRITQNLNTEHQNLIVALGRLQKINTSRDRQWWNVLRAVRLVEEIHRNYCTILNNYQDLCVDSHWTIILIFRALEKNNRIVQQKIRILRRELYRVISDAAHSDGSSDHLASALTNFSQFTLQRLKHENRLLTDMLNTLFCFDSHQSLQR